PGDVLDVTVTGLFEGAEFRPLRVQVFPGGTVSLPEVGRVEIGGLTLAEAAAKIQAAYRDGFLNEATVSVFLVQSSVVNVLVLGEVQQPGVYPLPKYQHDIGHAIAMAGGFTEYAAEFIEVHRRLDPGGCLIESVPPPEANELFQLPIEPAPRPDGPAEPAPPEFPYEELPFDGAASSFGHSSPHRLVQHEAAQPLHIADEAGTIQRIPLRGMLPYGLSPADVLLSSGDVVMVPRKTDEVFYVVGRLSPTNFIRFTVAERAREIGAGFKLPADRDIDVFTAVAMAGFIDPIDSPTSVTVYRPRVGANPLLIRVDLIAARYEWRENILVAPGDIIILNADAPWWFRMTLDRVVEQLIVIPYEDWIRGPGGR
ncbi:MAG: polysaccharide biosynthesis/export family protein, partial [Planctomycetaceae bacterium]